MLGIGLGAGILWSPGTAGGAGDPLPASTSPLPTPRSSPECDLMARPAPGVGIAGGRPHRKAVRERAAEHQSSGCAFERWG